MMMRCPWLCPLLSYRESRPKNVVIDYSVSVNSNIYSREMTVRIIHAGGHEEVYQNEVLVSKIMRKYPGMCVAKPEVFKFPHESLLSSGEVLLPGHKYFLIPYTTVQKLKQKYSEKMEVTRGDELSVSSVCSAKEFYVPKAKYCKSSPKKHQRKKRQFVPPSRNQSIRRGIGWEPSLMSIEEVSP